MARKNTKNESKLNYREEIRRLKELGPQRLYLLWGPEDYLREQYLSQLRSLCLPEGEDSFSFRRMDGPELDLQELADAIDAMPFLTERSFVEIRDAELNKAKDPDELLRLLSDIPAYCTVALVQGVQYEPDGRLKLTRALRERAVELKFTQQPQGAMVDWIARRFAAAGKRIELEAAQRLIFISGDLMNRLIPEIEKVAAYARGDTVTVDDVEAVANHIPEAVVFAMTDHIAKKEYNAALSVLSELLSDRANEPIAMLAVLGGQMRRLYAARLAADRLLGQSELMEICGISYESIANRLIASARGFTLPQLTRAVELCEEADYQMKSSGTDDVALLKEVVLRIIAGESHA